TGLYVCVILFLLCSQRRNELRRTYLAILQMIPVHMRKQLDFDFQYLAFQEVKSNGSHFGKDMESIGKTLIDNYRLQSVFGRFMPEDLPDNITLVTVRRALLFTQLLRMYLTQLRFRLLLERFSNQFTG